MRRLATLTGAAALALGVSIAGAAWAECTTIKDGGVEDSAGNPISLGYDDWGYNYQAHMFNGRYCDYDRVEGGEYCDDDLMMKWNDAWLSKKDCGTQPGQADYTDPLIPDGKLDRHYPSNTYIGSGAWLTNHQSGKVEVNGRLRKWTYFVKIIAVADDAVDCNYPGYWCTAGGTEIGSKLWGNFAVIQEVLNDPSAGAHGILYNSPVGPGVGSGHIQ